MTIVTVFIILIIPKMVLALYEVSTISDIVECYESSCYYYLSPKRWAMDIIIRYLVMLNSSINFIIYCFVGSNFRNTLKQIFLRVESSIPTRSLEVSTMFIHSMSNSMDTSFGETVKSTPLETNLLQINLSADISHRPAEEYENLISPERLSVSV